MAEIGEFGGPSFGGPGALGGVSEEERELSNAIARNILGISTNPSTYGAPLDSPEAANLAAAQSNFNSMMGAYNDLGVPGFRGLAQTANTLMGHPSVVDQRNLMSNIGRTAQTLADPFGTGANQGIADLAFHAAPMTNPDLFSSFISGLINRNNNLFGAFGLPQETSIPDITRNRQIQQAVEQGMDFQDIMESALNNPGNWNLDPDDTAYEPSIELIDPIDITPSANLGVKSMLDAFGFENQSPTSQQEVDALMDDVLGMQFEDGINFDPDDMSMAIASTGGFESAFGPGFQGISPEVDFGPSFDTGAVSEAGGEALQEAIAQRTAESIIAQQAARQVTPESNKVTIPTSSGPNIVIDVTPPAPQTSVAPHRRTAPPPSPVKIAATSIAKPKAFKKLPKFAQEKIRQGKVPTTGSDAVQDMVRAFLAPAPKPIDYSNPDNRL